MRLCISLYFTAQQPIFKLVGDLCLHDSLATHFFCCCFSSGELPLLLSTPLGMYWFRTLLTLLLCPLPLEGHFCVLGESSVAPEGFLSAFLMSSQPSEIHYVLLSALCPREIVFISWPVHMVLWKCTEGQKSFSTLSPFIRLKFSKLCSSSEDLWEIMHADLLSHWGSSKGYSFMPGYMLTLNTAKCVAGFSLPHL